MKNKLPLRFAFSNPRVLIILFLTCFGVFLALLGSGVFAAAEERQTPPKDSGIQFGQSYHNDVSPPLRELAANFRPGSAQDREAEEGREARINPKLPLPLHVDAPDPVVDHGLLGILVPDAMPATVLNFDGMQAACGGCAPPDTDGAVGATQYVQVDNVSYQVFNKITGGSTLGPALIQSIWSGFGGVCQSSGQGDPVVLYDHLANRWLISQFAGSNISDECIAISTGSDATGSYNRYAFHLGANAFDYPKIGIWPDGYYMSANVFNNSSPFNFLGPQAIAFDRANMLTGAAATFVTPGVTGGAGEPSFLPSDLDGAILPTAGVGNPFVSFPGTGSYKVRLFHADFAIPGLTTFTLIGAPAAAGFTAICPSTRNCVPELGGEGLDAIGDRLMFRLAYRKFLDGHEAVVSNYTVSSGGVAGVRWFELRAVTTAPVVAQESTYQPDSTWRWMGSAAMDFAGDLAVGFSASSASIHPQIRYAGRLVGDPANTLAQGEATIVSGAGSQSANGNRWGDYSAMSLDPVDDCTFWYTQEYFSVTGINWKTRIANFKFPGCLAVTPTPSPTPTATATFTPTSTPTVTATATSTPTIPPTPTPTPTPSPIVAATVALPTATISTSLTSFVQPVTTTNLNASDNLVGFQGDFTFNSTVVTFQVTPAQGAGLTANNWTVTGNILPGGGSIRTLRISAFANNFVPLSGSGTLFQLNMTRVGGNGTSSALTWKVAPDNFFFVDGDLQSHAPTSTPLGNIAFQTGATVNMSGTVSYCSNPVPGPVPGVTLTMTGNTAASTSSDGSGNYSFSALPSGGSFTVTPTKADRAPGSAGINTVDVVAVQRHFLNITLLAPGCSTTAADVNLDTLITTTDVIAIQRFAIGLSSGIANAGMYQFNPASSAYPGITSNQTAQNYGTFVLGDVVSPFAERVGGPSQETAELPSTVASVALPEIAADQSRSNVIAAVKSTAVEPTNKLVGFQGDFTFDERVVTFENEPVQKAGITSGNWNVSGNVLPGTGPIRTLRVSAYSNDFTPLSGSGTLFELRMRTVSNSALRTPHSAFPLLWAAPPNQFIFIDADLKTQRPGNAAPGSVGANH